MSTKISIFVFRLFSMLLLFILMVSALGVTPARAAGIRYATPTGTGDCSSWANACTLQTALTGAASGDEIWVAAGVHKPTIGTDRNATFRLKSGVAIYGGFAGMETARDQRDPAANLTVLSGDIDSNDSQTLIITDLTTVTGNTTNSYHIVTGATGATLDGFTITAGNANGNYPNYYGGGMYNSSSSPILMNITFAGNSAIWGGGGMFNESSSPALTNATFSGNSAHYDGGGMNNTSDSNPILTNVTFRGNSVYFDGGGMYNDSISPTLTNVTFSGNSVTGRDSRGGGMKNDYNSNPTLTNVTFSGNSAAGYGGGMDNSDSSPQISNTIFWGNTAAYRAQISGIANISNSIVQGGYAGGTNIIMADPLLGTLGGYGGFTQTIPILAGSSAINTGDDSVCPATDQRGLSRPQSAHCDIGTFEYDFPLYTGIYYVKPIASGTGDCQSWANACTLQTALTAAIGGNEIWVAAGTHKPATGTNRSATFQLKSGVAIYGGFTATESARDQRDPATNLTVLSGDIDNNDSQTPIITDLTTVTGNTTNSYHVVTGASGAILDGFNITAGFANGGGNWPGLSSGGGMYNYSSSPTLTNLTFSGNSADFSAGGMENWDGSPTLTNITFSGNSAGQGGGMENLDGSPTLTNVTFSGNSAQEGGGLNDLGNSSLTNVTFSDNSASYYGGGMYSWGSATLTNVTFSDNSADSGGGMYNWSSPTLTNVTFNGNSAIWGGGGMFNRTPLEVELHNGIPHASAADDSKNGMSNWLCGPQIRNTIFWGNTAPTGAQIYNSSSTPAVNDSVVQGGYAGTNIITTDPLLGTLGNYGGFTQTIPLLASSSAIDTGNDSICPATDQRGVSRPQEAHCDIGAFEAIQRTTIADFNGDGKTEVAIYRPGNGAWYINGVGTTYWGGVPGDIPAPADYNGDGKTEIAIYRSNAAWYINGIGTTYWGGMPGDIPVPADYNGDGVVDIAIYRPSNGAWYINGVGTLYWGGVAGDIPIPADFNADGVTEIAIYRPSNGAWYIRGLGTTYWGGVPGDIPVPADYNGDGLTDIAIYRPGNAAWYINGVGTVYWGGVPGDIPAPGDYNADGVTEIAIYRSNAAWYIRGVGTTYWGGVPGDFPLPARDTNGDGDPYQSQQ